MLIVWTNKTLTWNETRQSGILKDSLQLVNDIDDLTLSVRYPLFSSISICRSMEINLWIISFTERFSRPPSQGTGQTISESTSF